eukprot:scaffold1327_cov124-Cylindrotheca_fusiformis.AAC.10
MCPKVEAGSHCPEGCWNKSGKAIFDGSRECVLANAGYYSTASDDDQFPCPAGSFTSMEGESACHACPAGSFSALGSVFCIPCDPTHYNGDGANSIQVWQGVSYCIRVPPTQEMPAPSPQLPTATTFPTTYPTTASTTSSPTIVPTILPTVLVSANPSDLSLAPSSEHSHELTTNETSPEALGSGADTSCTQDSMIWHGQCRQCPNRVKSIVGLLSVAIVMSIAVALFHRLPDNCITGFWMGLEYMQLLYLLILIPFPNTDAFQILVSIISIFGLDTDATFSFQCMHGISNQANQALILVLPAIMGPALWVIQKVHKELPDFNGGISFIFYLWQPKLVLTSLEAMRCSPSSWYCPGKRLFAILGTLGLLFYGLVLPLLLLQSLRRAEADSEHTPKHCWKRRFPYAPSCWKWTAFLMTRKTILATSLVVSIEQPIFTLGFFLATLLLSEIIQRFCLQHLKENRNAIWLQNTQAAIVFQVSLLVMGAFSFAFWTSASKPSSSSLPITLAFFVLVVPTILYWILVVAGAFTTRDSAPLIKPDPPSLPHPQAMARSKGHRRRAGKKSNDKGKAAADAFEQCSPAKTEMTTDDEFEEIPLDEECATSPEGNGSECATCASSIPDGQEIPVRQTTDNPNGAGIVLKFWQGLDPWVLASPETAKSGKI